MTLPAQTPHGLIIDHASAKLYAAGSNGKLVSNDIKNGKVVASADIPLGVDQIAFDPEKKVIYSACKGRLAVTTVTAGGEFQAGPSVATATGAHTLAVDPRSHQIWMSYSDNQKSYLQKFTTNQ